MIVNWNDFINKIWVIMEYKLFSNILIIFESIICKYMIIIVFCELFKNILLFYFFCEFFIFVKYCWKYLLYGSCIMY